MGLRGKIVYLNSLKEILGESWRTSVLQLGNLYPGGGNYRFNLTVWDQQRAWNSSIVELKVQESKKKILVIKKIFE